MLEISTLFYIYKNSKLNQISQILEENFFITLLVDLSFFNVSTLKIICGVLNYFFNCSVGNICNILLVKMYRNSYNKQLVVSQL